jgi:hypothetical protein
VGVKNFVLMTLTLVLTLAVAVILKRMWFDWLKFQRK